jgi:hypothetical protein
LGALYNWIHLEKKGVVGREGIETLFSQAAGLPQPNKKRGELLLSRNFPRA